MTRKTKGERIKNVLRGKEDNELSESTTTSGHSIPTGKLFIIFHHFFSSVELYGVFMGCSADARVYQSLELQSGIKIICHIVKYRLDGSSCDYMTEWNINLNESSVSLPQKLI